MKKRELLAGLSFSLAIILISAIFISAESVTWTVTGTGTVTTTTYIWESYGGYVSVDTDCDKGDCSCGCDDDGTTGKSWNIGRCDVAGVKFEGSGPYAVHKIYLYTKQYEDEYKSCLAGCSKTCGSPIFGGGTGEKCLYTGGGCPIGCIFYSSKSEGGVAECPKECLQELPNWCDILPWLPGCPKPPTYTCKDPCCICEVVADSTCQRNCNTAYMNKVIHSSSQITFSTTCVNSITVLWEDNCCSAQARPVLRIAKKVPTTKTEKYSDTADVVLADGEKDLGGFSATPTGATGVSYVLTDNSNAMKMWFSDTKSQVTSNANAHVMACLDTNENNICDSDECLCSDWQEQSCGEGGCSAGQRLSTRTCNPAGCDTESKCEADDECTATDAFWANMLDEAITEADNLDTVQLIANAPGTSDLEFTIYEDNGILGRDEITTLNAPIINGKAKAQWQVEWQGGDGGEDEFIFEVSSQPPLESGLLIVDSPDEDNAPLSVYITKPQPDY